MEQIAIILAAGRGMRMGNVTDDKPKCLAKLGGKALISWQVEALKKAGITKVIGVGGYEFCKLQTYINIPFINRNWQNTNMVRSLMLAESYLNKYECIVSYSDIVYNESIVSRLLESRGNISITYDEHWLSLWSRRFEDPLVDA